MRTWCAFTPKSLRAVAVVPVLGSATAQRFPGRTPFSFWLPGQNYNSLLGTETPFYWRKITGRPDQKPATPHASESFTSLRFYVPLHSLLRGTLGFGSRTLPPSARHSLKDGVSAQPPAFSPQDIRVESNDVNYRVRNLRSSSVQRTIPCGPGEGVIQIGSFFGRSPQFERSPAGTQNTPRTSPAAMLHTVSGSRRASPARTPR